jgi:hypothetical protein
MPYVRRKKIAGKQVYGSAAMPASTRFHPQEILCKGVFLSADDAPRSVQVAYVLFEFRTQ